MLIGVLSDAHGNLRGLDICLDAMRRLGVDRVIYLGDAIGYLPYGAEVASRLIDQDIHCLMGNHEAMVFGLLPKSDDKEAVYGHSKFCGDLPSRWRDHVTANGSRMRTNICGREILFVHASPDDSLSGYVRPDDELSCDEDVDFVFMGHTHRPFLRRHGRAIHVNVGSCGLPRDHGALLAFAVLDANVGRVELFRIPIDVDELLSDPRMAGVHPDVTRCFTRVCSQPVGTLFRRSDEDS